MTVAFYIFGPLIHNHQLKQTDHVWRKLKSEHFNSKCLARTLLLQALQVSTGTISWAWEGVGKNERVEQAPRRPRPSLAQVTGCFVFPTEAGNTLSRRQGRCPAPRPIGADTEVQKGDVPGPESHRQ